LLAGRRSADQSRPLRLRKLRQRVQLDAFVEARPLDVGEGLLAKSPAARGCAVNSTDFPVALAFAATKPSGERPPFWPLFVFDLAAPLAFPPAAPAFVSGNSIS
jgi:hypothetical protein